MPGGSYRPPQPLCPLLPLVSYLARSWLYAASWMDGCWNVLRSRTAQCGAMTSPPRKSHAAQ